MRPKGTPQELEQRRLQAMTLLEKGHNGNEIARILGVTPGAVSQWKKIYQRDGPSALKAKRHPGPKGKLTSRQRRKLARLLLKGPRRHGYANELWTLARIAKVIRKHFGVQYEPSGVWRVLMGMGWSCQKPQRRARERDEEAVERWRKKDWPRIKKSVPKGL